MGQLIIAYCFFSLLRTSLLWLCVHEERIWYQWVLSLPLGIVFYWIWLHSSLPWTDIRSYGPLLILKIIAGIFILSYVKREFNARRNSGVSSICVKDIILISYIHIYYQFMFYQIPLELFPPVMFFRKLSLPKDRFGCSKTAEKCSRLLLTLLPFKKR